MSWWPDRSSGAGADAVMLPSGHRVRLDVEVTKGTQSDAQIFADIHEAAFAFPWSQATFEHFLGDKVHMGLLAHIPSPGGDAGSIPVGFILARSIAREAEILSVAVAQSGRRQGIGSALVYRACEQLRAARVREVFLEVGVNNPAGLALYRAHQFVEVGSRPAYYKPDQPSTSSSDALIMRLAL